MNDGKLGHGMTMKCLVKLKAEFGCSIAIIPTTGSWRFIFDKRVGNSQFTLPQRSSKTAMSTTSCVNRSGYSLPFLIVASQPATCSATSIQPSFKM